MATFPVAGPLDVLGADGCGIGGVPVSVLDNPIDRAIERALRLDRIACAAEAALHSWKASTDQFTNGLEWHPHAGVAGRYRDLGTRFDKVDVDERLLRIG